MIEAEMEFVTTCRFARSLHISFILFFLSFFSRSVSLLPALHLNQRNFSRIYCLRCSSRERSKSGTHSDKEAFTTRFLDMIMIPFGLRFFHITST